MAEDDGVSEWKRGLVFPVLSRCQSEKRGRMDGRNRGKVREGVKGLRKGRHLNLNADMRARVREQEEVRKGWQEGSWPWMQTDRQGNQRQAVTFSAAGGSKALFKGLVNAGCC